MGTWREGGWSARKTCLERKSNKKGGLRAKSEEFQYYSDKILAAASHANEVGLEEDEICWIRLTKVFSLNSDVFD